MNIIYLIAVISYYLQLNKLAYFLNRNRKRIITFHNILPDKIFEKNVANGVSSSFSDFKKIITEIGKKYKFSLDLDNAKTVTITFDDGYRNQVEVAGKYLVSKKIPAYLFVSGQLLNKQKANFENSLTVDKLLHWISYVPEGNYNFTFQNENFTLDVREEFRNQIWSEILWPLFNKDNETKGTALFEILNAVYPYDKILERLDSEYKRLRLEGVDNNSLENLKKEGWEIGWHGQSHYPFSQLKETDVKEEINPDKVCNSNVFSFPYGGLQDVTPSIISELRKYSYFDALSNVNFGNDKFGKWYRSRLSLPANKYLLHFELSGLKYLLKHRRLLPKF